MQETVQPRQIRSYVRREGRMTYGQRQALTTQAQYLIDHTTDELQQWLSSKHEQVLEIGFGQGENLLNIAQNNPQHRHLGIDVYRPGIGYLLNQINRLQLDNVRVCSADACDVLKNSPDLCFNKIFILFPDPWPKKRHHKRRLIQAEFIQTIHSKLKPSGIIHIATDWQHYAEHVLTTLEQAPDLSNIVTSGYSPRPDYRITTRFERRGQKLGHQVWDIIFQRTN